MKGSFWRKTLSVCLALLMIAALIPAQLVISAGAVSNTAYIYRWWDSASQQVKSETRYAEATKLQEYSSDLQDLNSGWYYSQNWIEFNKRVNIHGTVNIIICSASNGGSYVKFADGIHVGPGNTLNIYGQGDDTQALEAFADTDEYAGIGGNGNEDCGTINIYGGAVNAEADVNAAGIGGGFKGYGGNINIYGGKINTTGGSVNTNGGAGIGGGGQGWGGYIKIYGGDVTAHGGANAAGIGGGDEGTSGDVEIFGGTVNATGGSKFNDGGAGIGGGNEKSANNIVIYNGNVTAKGGPSAAGIGGGDHGSGGNITIAGGTVNATSGREAAGIGGGEYGEGGTITIRGGNVTAICGNVTNFGGAGIGGGHERMGGHIKIYDGDVTAKGGADAAGIGGGAEGMSGDIEIFGGTVNATGGSKTGDGGAGIGGGRLKGVNNIVIYNGNTTAQGGAHAAGIGGGDGGVDSGDGYGNITIAGGTVNATGGDHGAGIGSASEGSGFKIKLTDANVTATGGSSAAGIGGGSGGSVDLITITRCTINATGGDNGPGIGNGDFSYNHGHSGCTINITDSDVTAKGGCDSAGIGGGDSVSGGTITITGGTINATGGDNGAGIGSGDDGKNGGNITINSGTVIATGGKNGAGIGDGDGSSGGVINIKGGNITATGGEDAPGINVGDEGDDESNITISGGDITVNTPEGQQSIAASAIILMDDPSQFKGICVKKSDGSIAPKNYRTSWCSADTIRTLRIMPCEHDGVTYTDRGQGVHTKACPHCSCVADESHIYAEPTWDWAEDHLSATVTFNCEKCGHKGTVAATVEKTVDDAGMATYTAVAQFDGKSYTNVKTRYADELSARVVGHSISLEGDIGVNFYMELSDAVVNSETAYVHFTIPKNGEPDTQVIKVSEAREVKSGDKTYYVFKCQVAAKEMTSEIKAQIIDGEKQGTVFTYSVKEYADYLLTHTDEREDLAKAAPLVKALLNYGAYTQIYFDKNPEKLANVDLTEEEKALGEVSITVADYDVSDLPAGVTFAGASLSLKSETTLSLYFKSDDDLEFSCGDYFVQDVPNGEYQVARIRGIKATDIGDMLTLKVNGNAVTYSPLNYIKKALNGGTDDVNLQNAVKALYLYWDAANMHFEGVDLSTVTERVTVKDGGIITGTLSGNHKISIADGATVRLRNADITLSANSDSARYAGITLLGDATIILEGTNTVRGGYIYHPGIFVPEGKTLTIDGTGSLDASSNGYGCGIGGCGFEHDMKCGNITINGGNITATGGNGSAGIGCGHSRSTNTSCGDITINDGTVTAIGGEYAAGIGCGYDGNCGNITINNTVTQVTAISGGDQYSAIGIGSGCSCGTVTIGGVRTGSINQRSYTYRPE